MTAKYDARQTEFQYLYIDARGAGSNLGGGGGGSISKKGTLFYFGEQAE